MRFSQRDSAGTVHSVDLSVNVVGNDGSVDIFRCIQPIGNSSGLIVPPEQARYICRRLIALGFGE